ncbi:MAG: hypothetical protein PHQ43_08230 [Dehalococcoidales bacterium]|nr:hypothetical protein [Dehalococcoidales bacterium]
MVQTGPYNYGARNSRSLSDDGKRLWGKYIHIQDCFDRGLSRQNFGAAYDIATLAVGGGGNDVTTVVSHNTLLTGAVIGNQQGTRIHSPLVERAREFFAAISVELTSVADVEFRFGFYIGATEYVYIEFDKSVNNNWRLTLNDTTGAEFATANFGAPSAGQLYIMRLWVETDGTPHWAMGTSWDNVHEISNAGIAKKMTASAHYLQYLVKTEAAAAKQADIDYLETIKLKI